MNYMPPWAMDQEYEDSARDDQISRDAEAGERPSLPITGAWSTVQQVADRHRRHHKTIRKEIKAGRLKATVHPPGATGRQARYRIAREDEEAWIEAGRQAPAAPARAKVAKPSRSFRDKV